MTEPFLGQMIFAAFEFPPKGYAQASGSLLPINQNQALFSLLGTTYGGNGNVDFALPDLRGRVAVHAGAGIVRGEKGGSPTVTLNQNQMPQHGHEVRAHSNGDESVAAGSLLAGSPSALYSTDTSSLVQLNPESVGPVGGGQAHENMQPYTVIGAYIAIQGIFPSPN